MEHLIKQMEEGLKPHCESSSDWANNFAIDRCVNIIKIYEYVKNLTTQSDIGEPDANT